MLLNLQSQRVSIQKNHIIHFLKYASRYIDDLNIPNINDSMCQIIGNDIYPDELDIISTNICNLNTTFLDLDILYLKK